METIEAKHSTFDIHTQVVRTEEFHEEDEYPIDERIAGIREANRHTAPISASRAPSRQSRRRETKQRRKMKQEVMTIGASILFVTKQKDEIKQNQSQKKK